MKEKRDIERPKGETRHALDHFCDTFDFVVVRTRQWLYDWRVYSYPPGYCHCRGTHSNYAGAKPTVAIGII